MAVFERITNQMHSGMILQSPVQKKPFEIQIESDRIVFLTGTKTPIPMPNAILNDIPDFIRGQGWVKIGMGYNRAVEGTLQNFIDSHPSRGAQHSSDANYVAVVLKQVGIVEITINKIAGIDTTRKSSKVS